MHLGGVGLDRHKPIRLTIRIFGFDVGHGFALQVAALLHELLPVLRAQVLGIAGALEDLPHAVSDFFPLGIDLGDLRVGHLQLLLNRGHTQKLKASAPAEPAETLTAAAALAALRRCHRYR